MSEHMTSPGSTGGRPTASWAKSPGAMAVVTGASSGIGAEFARKLATDGYNLLLVGRDERRLTTLADDLSAGHRVRVEPHMVDLRHGPDAAAFEERVRADDTIEILVNNAGYAVAGLFTDTSREEVVDQIELNIVAALRLTRAVLPGMRQRRRGGIINVSSITAYYRSPGTATYAASKSFITAFSASLAAELKGAGVVVTCVCPGFTRTAFHTRAGIDVTAVPTAAWQMPDQVVDRALAGHRRGAHLVIPGTADRVLFCARHLAERVAGGVVRQGTRVGSRVARQRGKG